MLTTFTTSIYFVLLIGFLIGCFVAIVAAVLICVAFVFGFSAGQQMSIDTPHKPIRERIP